MPEGKVRKIIDYLRKFCVLGHSKRVGRTICRDADEVKILGLSGAARPDYIITGDIVLLALREFNSIPVITPREFWEISKGKKK